MSQAKTFWMIFIVISSLFLTNCSALPKKEIAACNLKDGVIQIGSCITRLALSEKVEGKAMKICDQIDSGMRNSCKRDVATVFMDIDACRNNENQVDSYICLANIATKAKDEKLCKTIVSKKDEEFCYRQVAVAKLDAQVCDNIADNDEFKNNCLQTVDFALEAKQSDLSQASDK